jgi:hypothetical protein
VVPVLPPHTRKKWVCGPQLVREARCSVNMHVHGQQRSTRTTHRQIDIYNIIIITNRSSSAQRDLYGDWFQKFDSGGLLVRLACDVRPHGVHVLYGPQRLRHAVPVASGLPHRQRLPVSARPLEKRTHAAASLLGVPSLIVYQPTLCPPGMLASGLSPRETRASLLCPSPSSGKRRCTTCGWRRWYMRHWHWHQGLLCAPIRSGERFDVALDWFYKEITTFF